MKSVIVSIVIFAVSIAITTCDIEYNPSLLKSLEDQKREIEENNRPYYEILIDNAINNGTVAADNTRAKEFAAVNVLAVPASGFKLKPNTLVYRADTNGDGVFTDEAAVHITGSAFEMPACSVQLSAEFEYSELTLQGSASVNLSDASVMRQGTTSLSIYGDAAFGTLLGSSIVGSDNSWSVGVSTDFEGAKVWWKLEITILEVSGGSPTGKTLIAGKTGNFTVTRAPITLDPVDVFKVTVASGIANGSISVDKFAGAAGNVITATAVGDLGWTLSPSGFTASGGAGVSGGAITLVAGDCVVGGEFVQVDYKITTSVQPAGAGTIDAPSTKHYGENATVSITPSADYSYKAGTLKYSPPANTAIDDNTKTFLMPASDITISAEFTPLFDVSMPTGGLSIGSVNANVAGRTPGKAAAGDTVIVSVAPDTGYALEPGTLTYTIEGGSAVPLSGASFIMPNPAANVTLNADFSPVANYLDDGTATVTLGSGLSGTAYIQAFTSSGKLAGSAGIDPDGSPQGWNIPVPASVTGNITYKLSVNIGSQVFTKDADAAVAIGTAPTGLSLGVYRISHSSSYEHGAISTPSCAAEGSTVPIYVTPDTGYTLSGVPVTTPSAAMNVVSADSTYNFTMPSADISAVSAVFVPRNYTISAQSISNGSVTIDIERNGTAVLSGASLPCLSAQAGDLITINPSPVSGSYRLQPGSIHVNGGPSLNDTLPQFTMPAGDAAISAVFELIPTYSVSVTRPGRGGTLTASPVSGIKAGESVTITVTTADGYGIRAGSLKYTTAGGGEYLISSTSFAMPDSDISLNVEFDRTSFTYFVSSAGSDSNTYASASSPCYSPQVAFDCLVADLETGCWQNPLIPAVIEVSGTVQPTSSETDLLSIIGSSTMPQIILKGATGGGTIDANNQSKRILNISGGANVTLASGLILTGADGTSSGMGVYVNGSSTSFNMTGGTISGNTTSNTGAGVYITGSATFDMTGGVISGNTAAGNGGGVFIDSGALNMSGGVISGNTAGGNGAGVLINNGSLNISGGAISGNMAGGNGGGVYIAGTSSINNMTGGAISGNTATNNGGGVYYANGTFNISGGAVVSDDVYLPNGKMITVTGTLYSPAAAKIRPASFPDGGAQTQVLDGNSALVRENNYKFTVAANASKPTSQYYVNSAGKAYMLPEGMTTQNGNMCVEYSSSGEVQIFAVPLSWSGAWKIEAWGGSGASGGSGGAGGIGGMSSGVLSLEGGDTLYVYVGGAAAGMNAGWNGGAAGVYHSNSYEDGGGGGGASDVRILRESGDASPITWNDPDSIASRILVAGGGGGGCSNGGPAGGVGGGADGGSSVLSNGNNLSNANQTSGGADGGGESYPNAIYTQYYVRACGGGGGGYYGGTTQTSDYTSDANNLSSSGGGGSGFVNGLSSTPGDPTAYTLSSVSGYVASKHTFTNGVCAQGGDTANGFVPNPDPSGAGFVRITYTPTLP